MKINNKPKNESETKMIMYQNAKQRKCSEDIERRFPTINDHNIRQVYLETQRLPESSNHYQNTYSKNAFVLKNISYRVEDISDYLKDVRKLENSKKINTVVFKPKFKSILTLTPKTSTTVLETYNQNLKVA
jgi:hypothetical protein